ncbi:hypothetical protein NERG_00039 [Nematocida ausubeli]|uniref:Exocyst complex component Sec3 C-terminal domain-containing protein n=1 Tax=Nematocida ausubeli (strain ATCC PRA-371 / ERTm2) TaxID=1913371 RepID=H8Z8W8_NEMA1|nr:hypothetical protein NERG_00039 [Nematocida ausubeli]
MDNPDKIFKEPWTLEVQQGRAAHGEIIGKTEAAWARAQEVLPRAKETLARIQDSAKEVARIKEMMEEAKEDIVRIERLTADVEKEIQTKQKALKILDRIIEGTQISKEEMQRLQEPIFTDAQEITKIEEALHKVKKCLSISEPRILSIQLVKEKQKEVHAVSAKFEKKAKEFILKSCLKNKKSPTEVHNILSRYTEIINYLVNKRVFEECIHAYVTSISKLHRAYIHKKIEDLAKPFRKAKDKAELSTKIEEAMISLIQLAYSLASTEGYFLLELFTPEEEDPNMDILKDIFAQAEQEIVAFPGILYGYGYEVGVINLLANKFEWLTTPTSTPSETLAIHRVDAIVPQIKKKVQDLKAGYMQNMKKIIAKEYSKEGAIEMDKTFYATVDASILPSINTEILKLNLVHSSKISAQSERVYQTIKKASILGSMQAHYLENKGVYEPDVDAILDDEIEKTTGNLIYLAEEKVFEKEKLSSIVKRAKEIMNLLNNVENPLGFRLQIAFKDMVLSKANFHQKNEIAAVLTDNKNSV